METSWLYVYIERKKNKKKEREKKRVRNRVACGSIAWPRAIALPQFEAYRPDTGQASMYNDCPVFHWLTKGILSRSNLIVRRGGSFFLFQLIRSLHEDGRTQEEGRDGGKDLKCKTNLGRFKFNTVNDLTAHFATLQAALRSVISLSLSLSLSLFLPSLQFL